MSHISFDEVEDTERSVVFLVDDDQSIRRSVSSLLRSIDTEIHTFETAEELLSLTLPEAPTCIILDVRLRGYSGLQVQAKLNAREYCSSIIFLSGFGDIPVAVAAMKAGAVDFLVKPLREQELLDAVFSALRRDKIRRMGRLEKLSLKSRFEAMTERQRSVMELAVIGDLNKQIADKLQISEVTVKIHRRAAMQKMQAKCFAELVTMASDLGLAMPDAARVELEHH